MNEIFQRCPQCGSKLDAHSSGKDRAVPAEGDISVCLRCGLVQRFREKLVLSPLTVREIDELPTEIREELQKIERARRSVLGNFMGNA